MRRRVGAMFVMGLLCLALAGGLSSCSAPSSSNGGRTGSAGVSGGEPSVAPTAATADASCTPTVPNGDAPPGEPASAEYFGNGRIRTVLWPDGTIVFEPGGPGEIRPDGSLAMKFGFWRGKGVAGQLVVTGRSLDRPGLNMMAEIPEGYGAQGFQSTVLVFPGPGCWQVTARAGADSLTFVTRVVRRK